MASDDTLPQSQPASSGPGTHPSASSYLPDLPLAEDLQAQLGSGYIVENFLGQGGMGAVYKGLQMPLRRPVAIKILQKRQAAGGEDEFAFEERFKREAYAMAALTHPHIVQVYDCGDAGPNYLFISMELVEGGDLSDAIKAGQVTPEVALKLIPQICDGLQAAHERGIVHRDIKPANIFLTKDGRAKVADFGLAKKFDVKNTLVTKAGLGMGTPDYAAPEQYDGVDIDHRADIYAFGVMMYQMLTGRLPRGATFKMPSQLSGVDPRIDSIVQKAMESERDDRYQSTAEIKEALAQIAATPQELATPVMPVTLEPAPARPSTVTRPVTTNRPVTAGRPATAARGVSQPVVRPGSGALSGARAATAAAEMERVGKKPNLLIIGVIAAVVVGVAAMFLMRKPEASPAPSGEVARASAPSSASTSPAVEPPAPAKPGAGQWTRVPWSQVKSSTGQIQGDKFILPAESYAYSQLPEMMNAFIRIKVKRSGNLPHGLQIRQRTSEGGIHAWAAVPTSGSPQGMIQVCPDGKSTKREQARCDSLAPDKESTFEFGAIGDQFIMIVDGRTIVAMQDDSLLKPGGMILFSGRGQVEFRDLEVLPLDGLTEAQYPEFVKTALATARAAAPSTPSDAPATTPVAATPSSGFPPGKWVKPFSKFEDLPEVHRKAGLVKWEDDWLKPTDATKGFGFSIPGFKGANMAIRIVMRNPGVNPSSGPVLQMRMTSNDGRYEMMPAGSSLAISHLKEPTRTALATGTRRLFISPDRDILIEMAVVGNQIYARADDALVLCATDDRLAAGSIGIHSKSWIRDLEVMNLDGVSEAEALRLIGVDEKGNDLRLPDSEKFVPGQWTKIYTQADQLPPDVRLPTSGVTWDDGWIHYEKSARLYLPSSLMGNYGVRTRFHRDTTKSMAIMTLRNQSFTVTDQYRLYNAGGNQFKCAATKGSETFSLFYSPVPTPVSSGSEYTMEFGAVGNRLVGRMNGSLVRIASDDRYRTGHAYFTGSESTRDIEVINLDGLPEAEALRLLGVDEAGNDVRPQELQRVAQARMNEAIAAIPEVKPLHDQFLALQSERVTGPFEADLAKLNTGYLGGLDRALSEAKAAGRTSDVEALEAEKKLIADRQPLPLQDDEKTPDSLKKLRGIYRPSRARIDVQRQASLNTLTGPLQTRLTALATDFTGKGRDADAKVVQEFMVKLTADVPAAPSESGTAKPASTGVDAVPATAARTLAPADPRAAAEWVLSLGGTVDIDDRGARRTIRSLADLPKGRLEILKVWLDKSKPASTPSATFSTLEPIAGLKKLSHVEMHFHGVPDSDADVLASLPALQTCIISDSKLFTGERLGLLRECRDLKQVGVTASNITPAGLAAIATLKQISMIDLTNTPLTDDDLSLMADMKGLRKLYLRSPNFTAEGLGRLKKQDGVVDLGWRFRAGTAVADARVIAALCPKLVFLAMEFSDPPSGDEITEALSQFSNVSRVWIPSGGQKVTDDHIRGVVGHAKLVDLQISANTAITDSALKVIASHGGLKTLRIDNAPGLAGSGLMELVRLKSLTRLDITGNPQIDDAAVAEFKKQRPDVTLVK